MSTPCITNNPAKEPSVTPTPPGINEATPINTDAGYVAIDCKKLIECISKANKIR